MNFAMKSVEVLKCYNNGYTVVSVKKIFLNFFQILRELRERAIASE